MSNFQQSNCPESVKNLGTNLVRWKKYKRLLVRFKWVFTLIAICFLFITTWHARLEIYNTLKICIPGYLILAVILWSLSHILSPLLVFFILKACGSNVPYLKLLGLHVCNIPARYIPGGIWHTVARVGGLNQMGVPARTVSTFIFIENLVAPGVTLSIGGGLVAISQNASTWALTAYLVATVSLVSLMLGPLVVNSVILKRANRMPFKGYLVVIFLSIIFWSFGATSFLFFISSMQNTFSTSSWVNIIGSYLFSWGIGFVAFFAPQGVGVFEFVAANTMSSEIHFSSMIAFIAGFRLIVLLADVAVWLGWTMQQRIFSICKFN